MGKPTGFLEYARELPADRAPLERVKDWNEFHPLFEAEETARRQGARCMDCGIPFCHSAFTYDGAASGCPIRNLIPEWNDLMYRGLWHEAWLRLRSTNPFPEFTSRVCPAPCEGACTEGINDPPVAIRHNEHAIDERAWEEGWYVPRPQVPRSRKRVAVIGSGPSGLACADALNRAGHDVFVYERADRAGGLLAYGIPNMKLDKGVVARRVALMEAEGVRFITGIDVGKDLPAESLLKDYEAVVLCLGSRVPRDIAVPGRELAGVEFAVDYLTRSTARLLSASQASNPRPAAGEAAGRNVVVIGGGDTGTDCVATAMRQGCASVTQLEILPKPALERPADNPWPRWPRILRTDYGQEEAIALQGGDPRQFLVTAKAFEGDGKKLTGVRIVDVEWKRSGSGPLLPADVSGSERVIPADLVLIAMGFLGTETGLLKKLDVPLDSRGRIAAEYGSFATRVARVFAAGDARRGQSLVVWAMHEGIEAARAVDSYLMGGRQR